MQTIDFSKLRRDLDDAITYADFETARQLSEEGLVSAQRQELLGEIMYFRAQREILNEDYEEAINCLSLAIKYNPRDGAAYNDRALCIIELGGNESQALADFDKGVEVEAGYASVYHNKGWYLNKLGRHQEAIPYFEKTLELEPGRAVTYENLADTYLNLGEKQKAIEAFQAALQYLKPCYVEIKDQLETRMKMLIVEKGARYPKGTG
ncbi:MAG: tetratricopeptide repeat protein [Candidatus Omnitrophica bacterium]|nr:tetratricopeptide repeat protein [Candidatus Omnitrophota bacterium]